ncbi:hypothetical protein QJQ45_001260 [Haematococcus lacustris]|nr:hypothetical protein QJQ45_001260 [Haematococcus lacustris]
MHVHLENICDHPVMCAMPFQQEAEVLCNEHCGCIKQVVIILGSAGIGTRGEWGAKAVLQACLKVMERPPRGHGQLRVKGVIGMLMATSSVLWMDTSRGLGVPSNGSGTAAAAPSILQAGPQGRWVDRDCNATLNMQRIGEAKWRPLELCYWPDQGKLPAKGKKYPELWHKCQRDKPPMAQQQQQPAAAQ